MYSNSFSKNVKKLSFLVQMLLAWKIHCPEIWDFRNFYDTGQKAHPMLSHFQVGISRYALLPISALMALAEAFSSQLMIIDQDIFLKTLHIAIVYILLIEKWLTIHYVYSYSSTFHQYVHWCVRPYWFLWHIMNHYW